MKNKNNIFTFSILALVTNLALLAQNPPQPSILPDPSDVTLNLVVDGEKYSLDFSPEMIASWNKFLQGQNLPGDFAERFLLSIQITSKNIMLRSEFAPDSIKTKLDAEKAAQQEKELAANTAAMGKGGKGVNRPAKPAKPAKPADPVK